MTIETTNKQIHTSLASVEASISEKNHRVLQPILYDLIALGRILKQLHWNIIGPNFRPIHLHMDEIYALVETATDDVAERLVATGHSPSGRMCDVNEESEIKDVPGGFIDDSEVLTLAEHCVRKAAGLIRYRTTEIEEMDVVTADLLHQITLTLEKQHWMIQAQRIRAI